MKNSIDRLQTTSLLFFAFFFLKGFCVEGLGKNIAVI